jgi:threonine/homoserine/homoserine lactone efflux protein
MAWHVWISFAAAAALMGLLPGPGVASIVGYAVSSGRKTALASVAGMALGNLVAMTLSLAGVGALLAASALLFAIVKWVGAVYLIVFGVLTVLRSKDLVATQAKSPRRPISPLTGFSNNVLVGTFHPKTIVFFVAFVPQFIDPQGSYLAQSAILIATFFVVVGTTDSMYALAASRASDLLQAPKAQLWSKRLGGAILIGAGAATAMVKK